jgi:hypothetical protein
MLTRDQFLEWMAFVQIEGPLGGGREDLYAILQSSGAKATDVLWWLKEHVDEDDTSDRGADMYIPSAEERAWVAALPD